MSEVTKEKLREIVRQQWQNPEFVRRVVNAWSRQPSTAEQEMQAILDRYFPKQFKYNGDFSQGVTIAGFIPDFINVDGRKEVIEVFGDIFHRGKKVPWRRTAQGKVEAYSAVGYRAIIVWASELHRLSEDEIVRRIQQA